HVVGSRTEEVMQKELSAADVRKKFEASGFQVAETPGNPRSLEVKKNGFTRRIELDASGAWIPSGYPLFSVRGLDCELEDRGYQKFWYHQASGSLPGPRNLRPFTSSSKRSDTSSASSPSITSR